MLLSSYITINSFRMLQHKFQASRIFKLQNLLRWVVNIELWWNSTSHWIKLIDWCRWANINWHPNMAKTFLWDLFHIRTHSTIFCRPLWVVMIVEIFYRKCYVNCDKNHSKNYNITRDNDNSGKRKIVTELRKKNRFVVWSILFSFQLCWN